MNKRERVAAALAGEPVDRVPVSAWFHFPADRRGGEGLAEALYGLFTEVDFDFVKVMNDNPYVDPMVKEVKMPGDLVMLAEVDLAAGPMAPTIDGVERLRAKTGPDVMITVTIFNTFATGQKLSNGHLAEYVAADAATVKKGLGTVAANLAGFAEAVIRAGADGIFLAADGSGDSVFEPGVYRDVFRPGDLAILEGASAGSFNIVHVHGMDTDFDNFIDYPAHAINWADRTAGPSIAEAKTKLDHCLVAGVDHLGTIAAGSPDEIRAEVRDAIAQSGGRRFILGPGCSVPNDIDRSRLRVMREAVEGAL